MPQVSFERCSKCPLICSKFEEKLKTLEGVLEKFKFKNDRILTRTDIDLILSQFGTTKTLGFSECSLPLQPSLMLGIANYEGRTFQELTSRLDELNQMNNKGRQTQIVTQSVES